jgi:hypothetical protein
MAIKVFGTGLGRTGTMSLKLALEQLGLGPCHHMVEVFKRLESLPMWIAAGAGKPDWNAIFAEFRSAVDYPSCKFWRELMVFYPEAKMIHTVRDPESWFQSTQATIFAPGTMLMGEEGPLAPFFKIVTGDYERRTGDRDFMIDYFRRHTQTVLATVPKDRLLVFNASDGWGPLCAFLDVPVPDAPFPRENSTEEFQARFLSGPPGGSPAHAAT